MGFREINMVSLVNIHGPIWQTFETISARNPCRLFQKFISTARHGRPSTACSHGPLWRTSATIGARNMCHPGGPSRPAVHGPTPRPALVEFCNNRRKESAPFVSKVHPSGPSRPAVHGPLWLTFETIGTRKPYHLFQKSIPAARHDRPSTARSGWLLKQSAQGSRAICFKSPSQRPVTTGRPRPALTEFWNNRRQESVPFVSKVHPGGPSRLSVHGPTPRPALVDFCNNRREESVPFVSKVHPSRPSRTSVHGRLPRPAMTDFWNNRRQESVPFVSKVHPGGPSRPAGCHGPLWRTSATIGARNPCRLFQKSVPAARHGRPSTAGPHGPLWHTSATIGARNPCRLFQKSVPAARHGRPSTARPHGPLWWTFATIGVRNLCRLFQKSISAARHGRPSRPALTNFWNKRRPILPRRCLQFPTTFRIAHAPCYTRAERATQSAARVGSSLFDFLTVPSTHYVPKIVFTFSPICRAFKNSIAIYSIIMRDLIFFLCIGPHQQSAIETSSWLW